MADFASSDFPAAGGDPNAFALSQRNSLAALGAQQGLTNQATFRANAAGLVAGDPTATAAALGSDPTATTNYQNVAGPNQRAQFAANVGATGSLAAAALNAPPAQRAAVYTMGRQALASAGYPAGALPPEDYPGDDAMVQLRAQSLPVPEQLKYTPQPLSPNPVPLLQSVPGGGTVGPGGVVGGSGGATSGGGITATPLPALGQASDQAGGPSSTFASRMIGVESGGNPNAQNPQSSAGGAGQFIDSTWLGLLPQVRPDLAQGRTPQQQLALKSDPNVSAQMVNGYAQQNAPKLAAAGVPVNDTTLALAHRFGPDVAAKVALAPPGTPIASVVGDGVMAVNPDLRNQTTGSIAGFYAQRVGGGAPARTQVASAANTAGMPQVANDASPGPAPAPGSPGSTGYAGSPPVAPQGQPNALASAIDSLRAQPPVGQPPAAQQNTLAAIGTPGPPTAPPAVTSSPDSPRDTPSASNAVPVDSMAHAAGLPGGTLVRLPDGSMATVPPGVAPSQPTNMLASLIRDMPATPTVQPNTLASLAQPGVVQPNALALAGQPQIGTPGAPAVPAPSIAPSPGQPQPATGGAPAASPAQFPFVRDPMTRGYVPVAGQAGFAYAQGPGGAGDLRSQRIPGAPGAGVDTKIEGGMIVSTDKQTGQIVSVTPGVVPNTARVTAVNDGSTVHLFQPGSGEVGSVAAQPNVQGVQAQIYAEDRKAQAQQIDVAQQSQQQQVRLLEARQAMQGLPTGSGGDARAAWSSWAATYLPQSWAAQFNAKLNLPDAVPAQEFAKLMTQSAGQQERAVAGARGGIGMMTLFKDNNPGLNMQPGANRDLLNAQLVATQADANYARGFNDFVNQNGQRLVAGQGYTPASQFDQQWLAQRNPQVHVAAAEAMNGTPFAFWSKGLSPDEGRRALQVVGSIDPTMMVQGKNGPLPVRQFLGGQ